MFLFHPGRRGSIRAVARLLVSSFLISVLLSAAPGTLAAQAPEGPADPASTVEADAAFAGEDVPEPDVARAFFDRLVRLAGEWRAVSDRDWSEVVTYEVIARGSVVMQTTTFVDAPDRKMVTMYGMDGDRLVATHYCEARNQPRLVAQEIDLKAGRAVFRFAAGGNLESRDQGHMDQAVIRILDHDHVRSRWTWYQDGSARWLEEIRLERRR